MPREREIKSRKQVGDPPDIVEKDFESYPDVAADIINVLLYGGQREVFEQNLLSAATETVYQGEKRLRNQYEDLAKHEIVLGKLEMIYLFANQSCVDHRFLLRKAGYTGAVYRELYERKIPGRCPVVEMVLYWGRKRWGFKRSLRDMFCSSGIPQRAWEYIDDLKLHVWEMRYLPQEVREQFVSDMRIVVDYLAEGDSYCSDRQVRHKAALIKMIRVLSGDTDVEDTADILNEMGIGEEDEIKVCELFEQYERKGRREGIRQGINQGIGQGIQAAIAICKKLNATFEVTAAQIKEQFGLSDTEVQDNMKLYW